MKKKTYVQPKSRVGKLEQTDIICTSQYDVTPQNEGYDEEEESVTDSWYN